MAAPPFLYRGQSPPTVARPSWCPMCHGFIRERRVGTDGGDAVEVCDCQAPLIGCWRELLAVHDRAMQAPRRVPLTDGRGPDWGPP